VKLRKIYVIGVDGVEREMQYTIVRDKQWNRLGNISYVLGLIILAINAANIFMLGNNFTIFLSKNIISFAVSLFSSIALTLIGSCLWEKSKKKVLRLP
jgi:hypothetical protein